MKHWKIAEAKAQFSRLIIESKVNPQIIYNRDKEISAVISVELFKELMEIKKEKELSMKRHLDTLFLINGEEPIEFEETARTNRNNAIIEDSNEMAM